MLFVKIQVQPEINLRRFCPKKMQRDGPGHKLPWVPHKKYDIEVFFSGTFDQAGQKILPTMPLPMTTSVCFVLMYNLNELRYCYFHSFLANDMP